MLRALAITTVGCFVIGAILTPPIYSAALAWLGEVRWPYSRAFDRVAVLVVLILLVVMRKQWELGRVKRAFQEEPSGGWWRLFAGVGLAFFPAMAVLPLVEQSPVLMWSTKTTGDLTYSFFKEMPAAILVSVVEECFFRVLVFEAFRRHLPLPLAIFGASAFYGSVHFIAPDKSFEYPGFSWTIGFEYLGLVAQKFASPGVFLGAVGLTLVGAVLCYAIHKTRSLSLCIGLHAGWFLIAKIAVYALSLAPGQSFPRGLNKRYFIVAQPWTWASILVVGAAVVAYVYWRQRKQASGSTSTAAEG